MQFSQKDLINNQKQLLVQPDQDRAISGFKVVDPTPDDQSVLDTEIERLQTNVKTIIAVNQLTTTEITNYVQNATSFEDRLSDLKPEFDYRVTIFKVDQQAKILTIQMQVKYQNQSATKTISLSKAI